MELADQFTDTDDTKQDSEPSSLKDCDVDDIISIIQKFDDDHNVVGACLFN